MRPGWIRHHLIDTREMASAFHPAAKIAHAETFRPAPAYQSRMQGNVSDGPSVKENLSAAVLGAIVGYFAHQHWPLIEAIIHMITG